MYARKNAWKVKFSFKAIFIGNNLSNTGSTVNCPKTRNYLPLQACHSQESSETETVRFIYEPHSVGIIYFNRILSNLIVWNTAQLQPDYFA